MDEEDRERLRLNQTALEEDLMPKDVLPYLFQEGIFTQDDWDEILVVEPKTNRMITRELLRRLSKRGKNAYKCFRQALDESGHSFLGTILDETKVDIVRREDWLNGLSEEILERMPNDQELNRLACNLGSNWEQIAVSLGLKSVQIDQLKMQFGNGHIPSLIFKMLFKWRSINGKKATWKVLLQALMDCDVERSHYESVIVS
ncbi:death domain-containing protein CRADD-like [Liolophura sinensis]|uniref:death domain-containing protein CRADD-like n=1 Tax=Liolophura sinensis TaxID=3198878 RepID=UPI0031580A19